MHIIEIDS